MPDFTFFIYFTIPAARKISAGTGTRFRRKKNGLEKW